MEMYKAISSEHKYFKVIVSNIETGYSATSKGIVSTDEACFDLLRLVGAIDSVEFFLSSCPIDDVMLISCDNVMMLDVTCDNIRCDI